ncbi:hypothetical protein HDU81_003530 [Chytriomyces hyalinus]|nr:hypothetical protein HDU81_003530 [Chytriomyces hyalinus]
MVDFLIALAATTTCDETHENPGMATVTRDRAETVELSLVVVDSTSSQAVHWLQLFVRPAFTAFSPFSVRMTGFTNDSIVGARHTLASAVTEIDNLVQAYFTARNRTFAFVTHGDHLLRFHLPREAKEKGVTLPQCFSSFFDIAQEAKLWTQILGLNQVVNPRLSLVALCHLVGLQHEGSTYRGIDNAVMISKLTIRLLTTNNANATISTVDDVPPGVVAPASAAMRHQPVFATPYNLATRLAEFYENESKFIYVTGLPFAASVNDIQSWLRQGNLVAAQLWMVKNQEGRPDGSGYIVFSSHADAHSAIVNLNGRAIDGRAIQTAPASEAEFESMRSLRSPFPTVQEPNPVQKLQQPEQKSTSTISFCKLCKYESLPLSSSSSSSYNPASTYHQTRRLVLSDSDLSFPKLPIENGMLQM